MWAKHRPLALVQLDAHILGSMKANALTTAFSWRTPRHDGLIDSDCFNPDRHPPHDPEDFGIHIFYDYEIEEMRASDIALLIVKHTAGSSRHGTTPVAAGKPAPKILSVLHGFGQLDIRNSRRWKSRAAYDHADITAIAGAAVAM